MRSPALLAAVVVVATCAASAAPCVRLGDAEIGFRMQLGRPMLKGVGVSETDMASLAVSTNGSVVTGVWKGHRTLGADMAVTATFAKKGAGWEYGLSWSGVEAGELRVEGISFPDVSVPRSDRSGVLNSRAHGMGVIRRPNWGSLAPKANVASGVTRSFQFIALLDEEGTSWYVDARDGTAAPKGVYSYKDDGSQTDLRARIGVNYGVPATERNTRSYRLPWRGLITPYSGGWWEAAAIYRPWARGQSWCRGAMRRRQSEQGRRLREICFWAWNRGPSEVVAPPVERFAEETGVPCAIDWYWWHTPSYDTSYPNFWPPREGVKVFGDTIARLRSKGVYTMVYVNGISQDMNDDVWSDGGDAEAVMRHDLDIIGTPYNVYTRHRLASMCGDAPRFQARVERQISHLADAGLDAVYMDQISCGAGARCWNPAHRHEPGDAAASVALYREYVGRVRAAHPGLALSSEECSEAFLDVFDSYISLFGPSYERCGIGVGPEFEAVPAWNAIYHGLIACFGTYSLLDGVPPWDELWPADQRWKKSDEKDWRALHPDQFPVEFARTVVWGNQPTAHAFRMNHATDPRFATDYRFMKDTVLFYRDHRDFLYDGDLLAPGRMSCAAKKVSFLKRGIYSKPGSATSVEQPALPVVFHNVWRAPDGRTAVIAVNWSSEPQKWSLVCPAGSAGGTLPPLSWTCESL